MSEENKLDQAKQGCSVFLRQLAPNDRVGLFTFNDQVHELVPIARFARQPRGAAPRPSRPLPGRRDGDLRRHRRAASRRSHPARRRPHQRGRRPHRRRGQLEPQSDARSSDELARQRAAGPAVRVFTIAYGSEANADVLAEIANASGGKPFDGRPEGDRVGLPQHLELLLASPA